MMKGQEFSTFKLLIAAVVAIAILGILLQILGGVPTLVGFEQQAREILRDARHGGVVRRGPEVPFDSGTIYTGDAFSGAAGGLDVEFKCEREFCEDRGWDSTLEITSDGDSDFLVCCDADEEECYIGIGVYSGNMSTKCNLN